MSVLGWCMAVAIAATMGFLVGRYWEAVYQQALREEAITKRLLSEADKEGQP